MAETGHVRHDALGPLLAERGITLSREQVYRLVTGVPERLSLATLAALCDILDCQPGDLIESVTQAAASKPAPAPRGGAAAPPGAGPGRPRPRVDGSGPLPGRHELPGGRRQAAAARTAAGAC